MASCSHLESITVTELPAEIPGCEDCLKIGGRWVHLRVCLVCGHAGCCDQSPNRHATKHYHATQHPLIRSMERGEDWGYCYPEDLFIEPAPQPRP